MRLNHVSNLYMLSSSQRMLLETKGVLVGRVLLGFMFFYSGIGMLFMQGPAGVSTFFESLGIPFALFMTWVVIVLKLGAGGALMAGYKVEEAALALAAFTLIATGIAHLDMADPSLGKNLAVVGGLLYAAAHASANRNLSANPTPTTL